MTSNREKKRIVQAGVRRAMAVGGFNTDASRGTGGGAALEDAAAKIRVAVSDAAYQDADRCPDCAAARLESGDPTALCERHIREALGM